MQRPRLTALARSARALCSQGWCSWCLTLTEHELVAKGSATPGGLDQYRCTGCRSTTHKCANYCGGMAAGPTRELCAVCLVPGGKWENARALADERSKLACTSPRTGRGEERRPVWQRDASAVRCPQVRSRVAYDWRARRGLTSSDGSVCRAPGGAPPQCLQDFGLLTRRHHCRGCGRVLCASCTSVQRPLPELGYLAPVRLCQGCSTIKSEHSVPEGVTASDSVLSLYKYVNGYVNG